MENCNLNKIKTVICDANILIDYFQNEKIILKLASKYCYDIYVPRPVFDEVYQLSEVDSNNLGLKIIEASYEQLIEAQTHESSLSFADYICFLLARDNKWICATNEKVLFNKCQKEGVEVIRGFKFMIDLCKKEVLSKENAVKIAKKIEQENNRITKKVVTDLIKILSEF
jgi:rRNA-processing protein FCF1